MATAQPRDYLLDDAGDRVVVNGDFALASGQRAVDQGIAVALGLWQGEYWLDEIRLEELDDCRDCPWAHSCTGNCPGMAHAISGEIDRPCPESCLKRFVAELGGEGAFPWQ